MATHRAGDEAEIRGQLDSLIAAIQAMDLERVTSLYAPDVVSFDVQPPLQVVGREAKSRNWVEVFTVLERPLDYGIRDLTIVVDGDLAFAHSLNRLIGTLKNGKRSGFWVRATACFRKIDGRWLIAHDHVSVPLDMVSGRGMVDLEP
jgi:uncharacterized protein (TIGR02246 family)